MYDAKAEKPLEGYSGTRAEKAEEIKRDYLFKKVPGDQVRARNEAIANRDRLRSEQILIKQRKARQHQLRVQYKQRQYENYRKESKLGVTRRPPPPTPTEKPRESTQPIKKKDWRYYRLGDENLWTDYYHVPLNRLSHVIPEVAVVKDKEAVDRVMKILAEEDELAEQRERVKFARAQILRDQFTQQMERNRMRDDYVFKSAPPSSRPASAAAIRGGTKGSGVVQLGGTATNSANCNKNERGEFAFALGGEENNNSSNNNSSSNKNTNKHEMSGSGNLRKGLRPKSAPVSHKKNKGKKSVFDRLSEPKKPVKKHELALQTGCAELKGTLVTDRALQEQLAHLSLLRNKGNRTTNKKVRVDVFEEESPISQPRSKETGQVPLIPPPSSDDADEEVKRSKDQLESFQQRLEKNPSTNEGLYMNPYSIYE